MGISLSPQAQPAHVSNWLQQRGFHIANHWAKMIRGSEAPSPIKTDINIEKAGEEHALLIGGLMALIMALGATAVFAQEPDTADPDTGEIEEIHPPFDGFQDIRGHRGPRAERQLEGITPRQELLAAEAEHRDDRARYHSLYRHISILVASRSQIALN